MIVYVLSKQLGAYGSEIQELELVEESGKFVKFIDRQGHLRTIAGKPNTIANMNGALTLRPSDIGEHRSGWVVSGEVKEDYFLWVNEFQAAHPALGQVWGDFENEVFFTSTEAYEDFRKYFSPEDWDYGDI